jgi:hypothetical protein
MSVEQSDVLHELLLRDPQARRRLDEFSQTMESLRKTRWIALQYYLYFTSDQGLTGHPNDLEKFYVLVPEEDTVPSRLRVLVGNGHSVTTPNNVLVLSGGLAKEEIRPHVIVEVGGHSLAPDVAPWTQFSVGWDINWHAYDRVWGVRDVQAMTGTGFDVDYQPGLTLPRDQTTTLTPDPTEERGPNAQRYTYALLNQRHLERLRRLAHDITPESWEATVTGINRQLLRIDSTLASVQSRAGLRLPDDSATQAEVIERIRSWDFNYVRDVRASEPRDRRAKARATMPWEDVFYQNNPHRILKGWAYRPATAAECTKFDEWTSITQFPPLAVLENTGEIPSLLSFVPSYSGDVDFEFRFGYSGQFHCIEERKALHFPGVAQLQLGFKLDSDLEWMVSSAVLGYDKHYFVPQTFSWFVNAGFYASNWRTNRHLTFQTGVGLSFMPLGMFIAEGGESPEGLFLRSIRIRAGIRFNPFHLRNRLGNVTWETSLDFRIPWLIGHRYL